MNKILIFDAQIYGHNLEYIHHLYERANIVDHNQYIFVIPKKIETVKDNFEWTTKNSHITIDYISDEEYNSYQVRHRDAVSIVNACLNKRILKYMPNEVFVVVLDQIMPICHFKLTRKVKYSISGIEYALPTYQSKDISWRMKLTSYLKYHYIYRRNLYKSIFILNNHDVAAYYNKKLHTNKFKFLTDPNTMDNTIGHDMRSELNIPKDAKIFIHIGELRHNKGSVDLLKAIAAIPNGLKRNNLFFIIAGRLSEEVKVDFLQNYEKIKNWENVIFWEGFCSEDKISSLYKTCDYVIAPYFPSSQSSGLVNNAAFMHKPLIVNENGFIGELVKKYHLGITVKNNTPECLLDAIMNVGNIDYNPDEYNSEHSIKDFCDQIFREF